MNPYGEVVTENYGDIVTVNGHSYADPKMHTENTTLRYLLPIDLPSHLRIVMSMEHLLHA